MPYTTSWGHLESMEALTNSSTKPVALSPKRQTDDDKGEESSFGLSSHGSVHPHLALLSQSSVQRLRRRVLCVRGSSGIDDENINKEATRTDENLQVGALAVLRANTRMLHVNDSTKRAAPRRDGLANETVTAIASRADHFAGKEMPGVHWMASTAEAALAAERLPADDELRRSCRNQKG
jgi:hypothetical protein